MKIHLSDHFTYRRLLRFVLPSVMMMLVSTTYSVVDGFFVSNWVGKSAFASVNLIVPALMAIGAIGQMFGTGSSALISYTLGTGNQEEAKRILSSTTRFLFLLGIAVSVTGFVNMPQIAVLLGANESLISNCVMYGRILICTMPFYLLQNSFQSLFVTAEKPQMGFIASIISGLTNIILDFVLVAVFSLGLYGAAIATALSWFMGGIVPIIYFSRNRPGVLLYFTRSKIRGAVLKKVCYNGMAGFFTNLATSIVAILYNYQLMRLAGENGVAAYGVIMYVSYVFLAFSMGYGTGSSPVVGYHYGAYNHDELKSLLKKSLIINCVFGIAMMIMAELMSGSIAQIFVSYDEQLYELTTHAIRLYSLAFLINGINIFVISFFTGLNNGRAASILSLLRTMVLPIIGIFLLPIVLNIDGIWLTVVFSECVTLFAAITALFNNRKIYHYV